MASAQDVQILLRFLSQDAKMPLAQAMSKVKDLQSARIITPNDIAKAEYDHLKTLFGDDKLARQVLNAAKRVSKKRTSSDASAATVPTPSIKKPRPSYGEPMDPATFEASLALPEGQLDENQLEKTVLHTNRAPLVLAFAVTLLKYTMPDQPLSSRLSLAQAICSANSQSKAKYIGLTGGMSAEDEGWGEGQPLVNIMNRQIRIMKRWGYEWKEEESPVSTQERLQNEPPASSQETMQADTEETSPTQPSAPSGPALWGVDLEALKKSNGRVTFEARKTPASQLPIYRPEPTRAYLLKSFETDSTSSEARPAGRKKISSEKEQNLGMLLGALDLLYMSWDQVLSKEDLDRRAWGWYVNVRPEVKAGVAGWGGKGNVALLDILKLRRPGTFSGP